MESILAGTSGAGVETLHLTHERPQADPHGHLSQVRNASGDLRREMADRSLRVKDR